MADHQLAFDVAYTPSREDSTLAAKEFRRSETLKVGAVLTLVWLGLVVSAIVDRDAIEVVFIVVVSLMVMAVLAGATAVSRRRFFKRHPTSNEEIQIRFDETRVSFHAPRFDSSVEWSYFGGIRESKNFYFLGKAFSLPKRVLTDAQQLIFRKLVLRNLPLTKLRPSSVDAGVGTTSVE